MYMQTERNKYEGMKRQYSTQAHKIEVKYRKCEPPPPFKPQTDRTMQDMMKAVHNPWNGRSPDTFTLNTRPFPIASDAVALICVCLSFPRNLVPLNFCMWGVHAASRAWLMQLFLHEVLCEIYRAIPESPQFRCYVKLWHAVAELIRALNRSQQRRPPDDLTWLNDMEVREFSSFQSEAHR